MAVNYSWLVPLVIGADHRNIFDSDSEIELSDGECNFVPPDANSVLGRKFPHLAQNNRGNDQHHLVQTITRRTNASVQGGESMGTATGAGDMRSLNDSHSYPTTKGGDNGASGSGLQGRAHAVISYPVVPAPR